MARIEAVRCDNCGKLVDITESSEDDLCLSCERTLREAGSEFYESDVSDDGRVDYYGSLE